MHYFLWNFYELANHFFGHLNVVEEGSGRCCYIWQLISNPLQRPTAVFNPKSIGITSCSIKMANRLICGISCLFIFYFLKRNSLNSLIVNISPNILH